MRFQRQGVGTLAYVSGLVATLSLTVCVAKAQVNTVNDGRIIAPGTYDNTAQGKSTFMNSGSGGLWLKAGNVVRGREVDDMGNPTNNGGTVHLYAPGSVVRVDGTINVSAAGGSGGLYLGNGGRVIVDSDYLFQNGRIFANGTNGGLVQINVAGMTMMPGSRTEARGFGGNGGMVSVNSNGVLDIRRNASIDTSGAVNTQFDRNIINLEGSVVNLEGVLRADGVRVGTVGSRGGTIRLVATGRTDLSDTQAAFQYAGTGNPADPTLSSGERSTLLNRSQSLVNNQEGDVHIALRSVDGSGLPTGGWITANGAAFYAANNNDVTEDNTARAGDGGTIILAAERRVYHHGLISANGGVGLTGNSAVAGGNGGTIAVLSRGVIILDQTSGVLPGVIQANGAAGGQVVTTGSIPTAPGPRGGQGGLIAFSYNGQMINRGGAVAQGGNGAAGATVQGSGVASGRGGNGGRGGLIVLSGDANPTGGGILSVNGGRAGLGAAGDGLGGLAGIIVSPNPGTLGSTQVATQYDGGNRFSTWGTIRPLTQQTAEDEILTRGENLMLLRRNSASLNRPTTLFGSLFSNNSKTRSVTDPLATGAAENIVLNKTNFGAYPYRNFIVGSAANNLGLSMERPLSSDWSGLFNVGSVTVVNDGSVFFPASGSDPWNLSAFGGSHMSILATGSVYNSDGGYNLGGSLVGGTLNIASKHYIGLDQITTSVRTGIGVVGFHGGNFILKSDLDIQTTGNIGLFNGTTLTGMTHRYQAGRNFNNFDSISANAGFGSLATPTHGGIITIRAANHLSSNSWGAPESAAILANGRSMQGYGGFVKLRAKTFDIPDLTAVQADGTVQDGTVSIQTLP
jgi:hypothetical protein